MRHPNSSAHASAIVTAGAVGLSVFLVGCSSPSRSGTEAQPAAQPQQAPRPQNAQPPPQSDQQRYDLKGKVVSVDKFAKRLTVDHEAIPGFMGAMAMPYTVKDQRLLEKLSPGDPITAKLVSAGGEYWLEEIAVTSEARPSK